MKSKAELLPLQMPNASSDKELTRWRSILERLGSTVWIWNTKTDEVEFTKNWLASMGYDDEKIKTGTEWFEILHPDDREKATEEARLCLEGHVDNYEQEFRLRKADGSYRWFMSRAQVLQPDQTDKEEGIIVVGMYTDTSRLQATQDALRISEQRWVDALEGSNVGVWDWNLVTNAVYFSPEWINMLHYVDGDLEPSIASWRKVVLPEDLEESDRAIARYLAGETDEYRCECRVKCKDGSIKWVLDRGRISERSADGKPLRLVGTHDDITELKTREQQIADAHTELKVITSQVPGVVYQGQRYPNGVSRFPFTSSGIEDLFGVESNKVVDSAVPLWQKIHEDDRDRIMKALHDHDGNPRFRSFEYRVTKEDGETRWLRNDANPKQSTEADGSRLWYGYISDVTDEKNRETEIREQRDRLDRITNLVPGALYEYVVHKDGSVSVPYGSLGMDRIFGVSAEEAKNHPEKLWQNIHPDFIEKLERAVNVSATEGVDFDQEGRMNLPGGDSIWARAFATTRKTEEGDTVFYTYVMDITKRKQADLDLKQHADALTHANEDLEQFNYVAAHDLKEPLRAIRHLAEWVEEDLPERVDESVTKNLSRMRERVDKLQALIDDLAKFSRAGRLNVDTEAVSIRKLLLSLVSDYEHKKCRIDIDVAEELSIETAKVALSTVLSNLISNAIAHHDRPHAINISISVARRRDMIEFEVADDGPGIDPEHHERNI